MLRAPKSWRSDALAFDKRLVVAWRVGTSHRVRYDGHGNRMADLEHAQLFQLLDLLK